MTASQLRARLAWQAASTPERVAMTLGVTLAAFVMVQLVLLPLVFAASFVIPGMTGGQVFAVSFGLGLGYTAYRMLQFMALILQ